MDDTFLRLMDLVEQILALPPEEQEAYIQKVCASQSKDYEKELRGLLELGAGDDDFMEKPLADFVDWARPKSVFSSTIPEEIDGFRLCKKEHPEDEGPNSVYEDLGFGGGGEVYVAEQIQPQRKVALKILKSSTSSIWDQSRFQREVDTLAKLNHPGISQIIAAGTVAIGGGEYPYFAMELVDGNPLTDYAKEKNLSTEERLKLFAQVCEAVEYIHGKGVVHRDLKPGNILVNSLGQPKVLDFGISFVTVSGPNEMTLQTTGAAGIGTPAYMSPEQTTGTSNDLDRRSDIFTLGIIGHELFTDHHPFPICGKSSFEVARIIRLEKETALRKHGPALKKDAEVIIGKALAKEKERRYQSAGDLAKDIYRYLEDDPIVARPPSVAYQLSKFRKRHPLRAWAVVALALLMASGGGYKIWQWDAYSREMADYFASVISRTGTPEGKDRIMKSDLDHHDRVIRLKRKGRKGKEIHQKEILERPSEKGPKKNRLVVWVNPEGVGSWHYEYDLKGRLALELGTNKNGETLSTMTCKYYEDPNKNKCTKMYSNADGSRRNMNDVYEIRYLFDPKTEFINEEVSFNEEKRMISLKKNFYNEQEEIEYSTIEFSQETTTSFVRGSIYRKAAFLQIFVLKRNPREAGVWRVEEFYEKGKLVERFLYPKDQTAPAKGNPFGEGVGRIKETYDFHGRLVGRSFWTKDGDPTPNDAEGGAATIRFDYEGLVRIWNYLDSTGNPKLPIHGASTVRDTYDDRGLVVERRFFDLKGAPRVPTGANADGYAMEKYSYDSEENLVEWSIYDEKDGLVESWRINLEGRSTADPRGGPKDRFFKIEKKYPRDRYEKGNFPYQLQPDRYQSTDPNILRKRGGLRRFIEGPKKLFWE